MGVGGAFGSGGGGGGGRGEGAGRRFSKGPGSVRTWFLAMWFVTARRTGEALGEGLARQ